MSHSRTASVDYDDYEIEYDEENQPGLAGSVQQPEVKVTCRIQDHYGKLQWIPSILACIPETLQDIDGILSLPYLFDTISLSGVKRIIAAYVIGFLGFDANVISSGRYVREGISAMKKLIKSELPEDWTPHLSKKQERIAKLLGCICVIPSSLYDCFATVYFAKQLNSPEPWNYTLASLSWFSNISSEGIESYGNIRDLIVWKKNEFKSTTSKLLYYGLGGTLGVVGAIEDAISVYCPVVALANAPYGSGLQRLILCGALPKILTSNFYVGQWSRDAIQEFVDRVEQKHFSRREISTFCFSLLYALILGEAKRGLTTSFLTKPGAELPFTLNNHLIELFGAVVLLRELVNNTKFIYPMVNEIIDYFQGRHSAIAPPTGYTTLAGEDKHYSKNNTSTLFQNGKTNGHTPTIPEEDVADYVPPAYVAYSNLTIVVEPPETAEVSPDAARLKAPK